MQLLREKIYFTILELLIVISIITILASLLLPGLKAAKDRARMILCSGNLRNLGPCLISYIGDNNDWCPVAWMTSSGGCGSWPSQNGLVGYTNIKSTYSESTYQCYKGTILDCPGIKLLPVEITYPTTFTDVNPYGWNSYGWAASGMGYKCDTISNQIYHIRAISVSPDTITLSDIRKRLNTGGNSTYCDPRFNWYENTYVTFGPRHGALGNMLFFDGHVISKKPSEISGTDTASILSKRKYWTHEKD